jgi:asparagine synthase (glutamine-hydrolysing)
MCGIAGEWDWSGRPREQSPIAAMIQSIAHRGPEGQACWFNSDGAVALAYAQLSFFKAANAQPVRNTRSSVFVVCNGEIYNHQELAGLIRQAGRNIELGSDVEIIPHLYELRGAGGFSLLRGEFAFALYDSEKRTLFLVRDRFGIKPLYYHYTTSGISFGSEIKAIFADSGVARRLDNASIATKLFGITLPGSTCFSDIREVKPGCCLKVTDEKIIEQPYWSPVMNVGSSSNNLAELAQEFSAIFEEAVRIRLHGDYPVGAYLSGGIDSSAVLASMVRSGAESIKAFTIRFEDTEFDESPEAVNVASQLGVEHHLVPVRNQDLADNFLRSIWHCEIPVINSHGTAKFLLSRAAAKHVKAVMTGEGADELFAGYPYFSRDELAPDTTRRHQQSVLNWWRLIGSSQMISGLLPLLRAKDVARLTAIFGCAPYLGVRSLFYARLIRRLLKPEIRCCFSPIAALELIGKEVRAVGGSAMTPTNVDRLLALKYDLPAYILNFLADREEMAHSIEGRVPFLDNEVVAFACKLGDEALMGEAAGKGLIRRAFAQRLPQQTLAKKKRLFLAPPAALDEILRSEWVPHLLSREVTDSVGVFEWKKLVWLKAASRIVPAHSGAGSAMRALLIFVISLHGLHDMFIMRRSAG